MGQSLYNNLTEIVANGIVGIKSIIEHKNSKSTYIPPTRSEIEDAYYNNALVHQAVKMMVGNIICAVEQHKCPGGEYNIEYIESDIVRLTPVSWDSLVNNWNDRKNDVTVSKNTREEGGTTVEAEDANYPHCSKCGNKTTFGSTGCAYCGHRF